jgi:Cu-Zn family superoxide dismutase
MLMRTIAATLLLAGVAAAEPAPVLASASAEISKADGTGIGSARLTARAHELYVTINARGLAPGRYGVHIHAVGRCEGPAFESAGPHWNPTSRHHGRLNPDGAHMGDLPNLEIGADGRGRLTFTIPAARLSSLLDTDGASIVIHAAPDDERTDPSGNSGARIACGVLTGSRY